MSWPLRTHSQVTAKSVSEQAQLSSFSPDALSAPLELCRRLSSKPGFWGMLHPAACVQIPSGRFAHDALRPHCTFTSLKFREGE